MSRAIYYASDDNPPCVYRLLRSVQSLRKFNQKIPVYVAFYGKMQDRDRKFLEKCGVILIYSADPINPYLGKFLILENDFPENELAYLDTDTICFGDVEELFTKTGPEDFHAREAPLCKRSGYPYRSATLMLHKPVVNYRLYDFIRTSLNMDLWPIYNLGIMVFKNGFHLRLREHFDQWDLLLRMFETKQFPYPCNNPYVSREIVTPMVFASIPNVSWSYLDPQVAPFYVEWRSRETELGAVMHVLTKFYAPYLYDFFGQKEVLYYYSIRPKKSIHYRAKRLQFSLMPIGGQPVRSKFAKKLVNAWVRAGVFLYKWHRKRLNKR